MISRPILSSNMAINCADLHSSRHPVDCPGDREGCNWLKNIGEHFNAECSLNAQTGIPWTSKRLCPDKRERCRMISLNCADMVASSSTPILPHASMLKPALLRPQKGFAPVKGRSAEVPLNCRQTNVWQYHCAAYSTNQNILFQTCSCEVMAGFSTLILPGC